MQDSLSVCLWFLDLAAEPLLNCCGGFPLQTRAPKRISKIPAKVAKTHRSGHVHPWSSAAGWEHGGFHLRHQRLESAAIWATRVSWSVSWHLTYDNSTYILESLKSHEGKFGVWIGHHGETKRKATIDSVLLGIFLANVSIDKTITSMSLQATRRWGCELRQWESAVVMSTIFRWIKSHQISHSHHVRFNGFASSLWKRAYQ